MGSTGCHRETGVTHLAFFQREFPLGLTRDGEVVAHGTGGGAWFAAVKNHADGNVWALIVKYEWFSGQYNFVYKEMGESMHPAFYDCPAKVLDLLSPTDDVNALEWREACRERLAKKKTRPRVKLGATVQFAEPFMFMNGDSLCRLRRLKANTFCSDTGGRYRLPANWREQEFVLVD